MNTTRLSYFDFLIPEGQEWFSPKEVAMIIGRTDQYVRDAFDNQKILGHTVNGRAPKGEEKRKSYRIHRESVLLYLLETANFEPMDFLQRVAHLLRKRDAEQLQILRDYIDKILAHRRFQ
ncbi:MAG: hypothetical protein LBD40_02235 [Puniceicoccales bacterium]|jgi:hypothetical protein|nr:hypothetical protein [Puniceicoccales bacterium]